MRTIYLDACAVNRPFDDQSQERIRLESEAVLLILARVEAGELRWIGSEVLDYEIACIPDPERLRRAQVLLQHTAEILPLDPAMEERARRIEARGFSAFDALHLAAAEAGGAEVFLSTDDALVRRAGRHGEDVQLVVANPLTWLEEQLQR